MSAAALTLYNLADTLPALLDTLDMVEEGTPERQELETQIQVYMQALPAKVDDTCRMLAHFEAQQDMAAKEIKRLQERKKAFERAQERLEGYVVRVLEFLPPPKKGQPKLEGATNTLTLRPSDAVKIIDEPSVPAEFKTACIELPLTEWAFVIEALDETTRSHVLTRLEKQDVKVRASDIKRSLKAGHEVPGADLEFRNNLVRK